MQKKEILWILLGLIVFIPIARYIDTAPEREKVRLEREKEETAKIERQKEKEELEKREKEEQQKIEEEEAKKSKIEELYRRQKEVIAPLRAVEIELLEFVKDIPGRLRGMQIEGDTYNEINFSLDTWRGEDHFYLKDITFFEETKIGTGSHNPDEYWILVRCISDDICIKSDDGRYQKCLFYSSFDIRYIRKVKTLINSLIEESKKTQINLPPIVEQIEILENS